MERSGQDEQNSRTRWICTCGKSASMYPNLLCLSFVLNIVFVGLFVVVFIQQANFRTELGKLKSPSVASEQPSQLPLQGNSSSLTPFPVLTTNATAPPNLIKVRVSSRC